MNEISSKQIQKEDKTSIKNCLIVKIFMEAKMTTAKIVKDQNLRINLSNKKLLVTKIILKTIA